MLSEQKYYTRIFRPWDKSDTNYSNVCTVNRVSYSDDVKNEVIDKKRENNLRKIRGSCIKSESNLHQDATISTTTNNENLIKDIKQPDPINSPVENLTLCCDRLLEDPKSQIETKIKTYANTFNPKDYTKANETVIPPGVLYNSGFIPDYLISDTAYTLNVPHTEAFLLESLEQRYALELEYTRIMQQENEAKLLNARKQRPKKYKCPHCQVGFSNNGQLKGHIRIHTGERPYKCDQKNCGKTFTRNEELTRHKRIHSGVRPFPCPTCGKKFGRRDHLKKHKRTHYLQAERMLPVFVPLSAMSHGFPYIYGY